MRERRKLSDAIDWPLVGFYAAMVLMGWANIYAAVYDPEFDWSIFELNINSGKQFIWIVVSLVFVIAPILIMDMKFFHALSLPIYGVSIGLLVLVMLVARDIQGAKSWIEFGGFRFQPSEFAKIATALALGWFADRPNVKFEQIKFQVPAFVLIGIPAILIVFQGDAGSALVFGAFILVLYREGLSPIYVILGVVSVFFFVVTLFFKDNLTALGVYTGVLAVLLVGLVFLMVPRKKLRIRYIGIILAGVVVALGIVFSINFLLQEVLEPHQRKRLEILISPESDPKGTGYQVTQSKIAIGSGGFFGKGYREGTQTKFDFVPDQSTDFIFCTVGEEHGWIGSLVVIGLFVGLIYRVVTVAERQKWRFARVYGYSVAFVFFFHFMINIGMTIGLFPVIGIPLPFFSYGGSSLMAFTAMLFLLIKFDSQRMQVLARGD